MDAGFTIPSGYWGNDTAESVKASLMQFAFLSVGSPEHSWWPGNRYHYDGLLQKGETKLRG